MPGEPIDGSGAHPEGTTPLDPDDQNGLVPQHLRTRADLNQWEALNIARGEEWAFARRTDPLSVEWLQALHRRMFGDTWEWAGSFRRSDNNISPYQWTQVRALLSGLVENARAQYGSSDRSPNAADEAAVRFHHQLVRIHPWPNGNGRHARVATDVLLRWWGRPPFTWGSGQDLMSAGTARARYIAALRAADDGRFDLLREFVRS